MGKRVFAIAVLTCLMICTFALASCKADSWTVAREKIVSQSQQCYDVRLGFAGDICFADDYFPMQHLAELGSTSISDGVDPVFIQIMHDMDLMWINNEFVYSTRGEPLDGKAWTFRSSPEHVKYMTDLGVDIVGLANNHTYDYGPDAFVDTLSTLRDAGIPYVGAGHDLAEAKAPVYLNADGFTIGYVAASCAEYTIYTPQATDDSPGILWCYDDDLFLDSIREAAANADYVVALPHWGVEHSFELESKQLDSAKAYIDAGADAVVGAHAHNLQGMEFYNGKPIVYNLGNFWFDDYDEHTMIAELRITGMRDANGFVDLGSADVNLVVHPGTQSSMYAAWANTAEWRNEIFRFLEGISLGVSIDDNGVVHPA